MTLSYALANGYSVQDSDSGLLITDDQGKQFTISQNVVTHQINNRTQLLPAQERQALYQNLLHAVFDLPEQITIQQIRLKKSTTDSFHMLLSGNDDHTNAAIEIKNNNGTAEFMQNVTTKQSIAGEISTIHLQVKSFTNGTSREYLEDEYKKTKAYDDNFEDRDTLVLSRIIKNKGKQLVLAREVLKFSNSGQLTQNDEKILIEISANEINKTVTVDDDRYKKKIKLSCNLHDGTVTIRLKRTDFKALPITEYKATILTHKTGKKVPVTTFYDKEFDALLTSNQDGTFAYTQSQTAADASLEKFKTKEDFTRVHAEIVKEVEHVRALSAKINILKNSQKQDVIDFTENPSIFDSEIDFASVKDEACVKLTDHLAGHKSSVQQRLLTAIAHLSGGNFTPIRTQNKQYS